MRLKRISKTCHQAVTGKTSGPSLYHLLQVFGKERVMAISREHEITSIGFPKE